MRLKLVIIILVFLAFTAPGGVEDWLSLVDRIRGEPSVVSIDLGSAVDIYRLAVPIIGVIILLGGVWWIERHSSVSKRNNAIAEVDSTSVTVTEDPQSLYGRLKVHNNGDTANFRGMARFIGDNPPASRHRTPWAIRWRTKEEEYISIGRDADVWLDVVSRERSLGIPNYPALRFWQATVAIGLDMGTPIYSDHFDLWEDEDAVTIEIWLESLGCVDISFQPDESADETQEAEIS